MSSKRMSRKRSKQTTSNTRRPGTVRAQDGTSQIETMLGWPRKMPSADVAIVRRAYDRVLSAFRTKRRLVFEGALAYVSSYQHPCVPTFVNAFGIEYDRTRLVRPDSNMSNMERRMSYFKEFETRYPHWGLCVEHPTPDIMYFQWMPVGRELPRLSELVPELLDDIGVDVVARFEAEHTPYVCPFEWMADWPAWAMTVEDYRIMAWEICGGPVDSNMAKQTLGPHHGHVSRPVTQAVTVERALQEFKHRLCRLPTGTLGPATDLLPQCFPTEREALLYSIRHGDGQVELFPLRITSSDCWVPGGEMIVTILPAEAGPKKPNRA